MLVASKRPGLGPVTRVGPSPLLAFTAATSNRGSWADGKTATEAFKPAADAAYDCFYIYPTVSTDPGGNSDMVIDAAERRVVEHHHRTDGQSRDRRHTNRRHDRDAADACSRLRFVEHRLNPHRQVTVTCHPDHEVPRGRREALCQREQ